MTFSDTVQNKVVERLKHVHRLKVKSLHTSTDTWWGLWRTGLIAQALNFKKRTITPSLWQVEREEFSTITNKFSECVWWENRKLRQFRLRASHFSQWIRKQFYQPFHHCQNKYEGTTFMEKFKKQHLTVTTFSCIFVKLQPFSSFLLDWSLLDLVTVSLNTEAIPWDSFFLHPFIEQTWTQCLLCQVLCKTLSIKRWIQALTDLYLHPQYLAHYVCTKDVL